MGRLRGAESASFGSQLLTGRARILWRCVSVPRLNHFSAAARAAGLTGREMFLHARAIFPESVFALGPPCLIMNLLCATACGTQATSIVESAPPSLAISGVVTSQTGEPLAGASVHSTAYQIDCITPAPVERDTLLIADSSGRFQGILRGIARGQRCVRAFAQLGSAIGAAQTQIASFTIPPSPTAQTIDTASFHLVIP